MLFIERERESEVGFAVWQAIQSRKKENKYNIVLTVQRRGQFRGENTERTKNCKHKQAFKPT